jgi:hypothetical protein
MTRGSLPQFEVTCCAGFMPVTCPLECSSVVDTRSVASSWQAAMWRRDWCPWLVLGTSLVQIQVRGPEALMSFLQAAARRLPQVTKGPLSATALPARCCFCAVRATTPSAAQLCSLQRLVIAESGNGERSSPNSRHQRASAWSARGKRRETCDTRYRLGQQFRLAGSHLPAQSKRR